ncbi:DUF6082 family protein [Streptomyces sp. NPDC056362]|uniref:DUF6082 family protein n=1 Tax=unclassified Streptomyces TaxID=2593676 RepID=UPI0035DB1374
MNSNRAVLTLSVVGAVGIALAERRHRQRLDLDTVALHQQLCADIITDPEQLALWALNGMSPEQFAGSVSVNRQISFTQAKYRLRLLDDPGLRVAAQNLMKREGVRAFWQRHKAFRFSEATNPRDRKFLTILDEVHAEGTKPASDLAA